MGFKSHIITFGVQARQPSLTSKENVFVKWIVKIRQTYPPLKYN